MNIRKILAAFAPKLVGAAGTLMQDLLDSFELFDGAHLARVLLSMV